MEDFIVNASVQAIMYRLQSERVSKLIIALAGMSLFALRTRLSSKAPKSSTGTPRSVVRCHFRVVAARLVPCAQSQWVGPGAEASGAQCSTRKPAREQAVL